MKLKIKQNNYGLRIYCTKCKKQYNYHNDLCNHNEHQHYKSLVTNGAIRKTKSHPTRNFDEALTAAIQFKKDVKNGVVDLIASKIDEVDPDNISILDAVNIFIGFKMGIDVPLHLHKEISKEHLNNIKSNLKQLISILRSNKVNVETVTIDSLDDHLVGYWYEYLIENYSEGSYGTKLKILIAFINYMIDEVGVTMRNPFKKVVLKPIVYDTSSISNNEFLAVLHAVDKKPRYQQLGGIRQEVKNNYRPYLIDGFKLALFTGLRREELVTLSWNDLYYSVKNDGLVFMTDNLKVERNMGKPFKKKYVPVGPDLLELLIELGYEDFKDSELYILHPQRDISIKSMMSCLSRGFSHYYKKAFPDMKSKKFKILRKTYLSYLHKAVGDDMIELSSHGGMRTLTTHYIDAEVVAKGLSMKIFE